MAPIPLFGSQATSKRPLRREYLSPPIISRPFHRSRPRPLTIHPSCSRYVALKFVIAELTGRNNEIKIHNHLASRSGAHPGFGRILAPLHHFRVQGPNGEHDVLVLQVLGPHIEDMFSYKPDVLRRAIKSLVQQVALGISFLHDCGVVHAG